MVWADILTSVTQIYKIALPNKNAVSVVSPTAIPGAFGAPEKGNKKPWVRNAPTARKSILATGTLRQGQNLTANEQDCVHH
jgi:hypothetical protein